MLSSSTPAVTLSVRESIESVGRNAWNRLTRECSASVFYSFDFLRSVEDQPLTYPSKAYYLVAEDSHRDIVAALPVYLQETLDPFSPSAGSEAPITALFGHVWHCYDSTLLSSVPLARGLVERFWDGLRELALEHRATAWGLVNLPADQPLAKHLHALGVPIEETAPRYRLPMAAQRITSLEHHLSAVGQASRRTLNLSR